MNALAIVLAVTAAPAAVLPTEPPIIAAQALPIQADAVLPRNTPVELTLNQTLNTKSKANRKGATFALSVDRNVLLRSYVVIPRGSRAVGTITSRTGKGAFGKSGKMEISLDYIEVGDTRIPIEGRHREEGDGNSTATIATFVFVSMLGSGLITGHSAEIPAGKRFTVWTKEDMPVQLPAMAAPPLNSPAAPQVTTVAHQVSAPGVLAAQPLPSAMRRQAPVEPAVFGNGRVRCMTCR